MVNGLLEIIAKERPVGTYANTTLIEYLETLFNDMGYSTQSLPFECLVWDQGNSTLHMCGQEYAVSPSPFSTSFRGTAPALPLGSLAELQMADCKGKILIMHGELTQSSIQPKNYPFYYPDEHKAIITALEESGAVAVLAVTDRHPVYGLNPFYIFEDGNFKLPSAYLSADRWTEAKRYLGDQEITLHINSRNDRAATRQIIARKAGTNTQRNITLCAHMDSKYNTPGALDNAAGLTMMVRTMELLKDYDFTYNVEFVPFNSEEYFGATGELEYIKNCERRGNAPNLFINIDSPGHIGSQVAVSSYNADQDVRQLLDRLFQKHSNISAGPEWYSGDHAVYSMKGVPSLAVASSDLFEGGLLNAHTSRDTLDIVDSNMIESGAVFLVDLLKSL